MASERMNPVALETETNWISGVSPAMQMLENIVGGTRFNRYSGVTSGRKRYGQGNVGY